MSPLLRCSSSFAPGRSVGYSLFWGYRTDGIQRTRHFNDRVVSVDVLIQCVRTSRNDAEMARVVCERESDLASSNRGSGVSQYRDRGRGSGDILARGRRHCGCICTDNRSSIYASHLNQQSRKTRVFRLCCVRVGLFTSPFKRFERQPLYKNAPAPPEAKNADKQD